jgi:acyl-coenzyme A synthetase/AMP-(fatty) acid ligase
VVLRDQSTCTDAELVSYCRDRLAEFKCPKKIHITQTIPRTATGKIQRRVVAAAIAGDPA